MPTEVVPERHCTRHEQRAAAPHRSNPRAAHRELATLDVCEGMDVVKFGNRQEAASGALSLALND
ncbi:hypothetical protein [Streptomyces sp. NPDC093018]|uniref:hypothetical protein n=1 Tax=Streptomyces sp. NPDC093018 TaxID=3155067 RepID=UPI00344959F0